MTPENYGATAAHLRRSEIETALLLRGLAMQHSLAVLDGDEGHAIIDLASGESINPLDDEVCEMATEWSLMEGAVES